MAARRPGLVWHAVPMPGRLDWTREEIILAMDFYVRVGGLDGASIPYHDSEAIGSLSALLIRLGAYPPQLRGQKYRNPNGIYLKLMNLRAVQAEGAHGMPAYSQLDAAVWRDYSTTYRDCTPKHRPSGHAWMTALSSLPVQSP